MKNFKELFITKRDIIYSDVNEIHQLNLAFFNSCTALKSVVTQPEYNDVVFKGLLKNVMGYRGVGKQSGIWSGYRSKAAYNSKGDGKIKKTNDHVVGATMTGELVLEECEKADWNIDSLIKQGWIHENLYLWGTIQVTKFEHKPIHILRNKNKLSEKLNLEHYIKITINDLMLDKGYELEYNVLNK
jgi:hypothetical protein